jgi:hypothetical protein
MTQGVAMSWLVLRLTGNGVDLGGCVSAPDGTARQVYVIDLVGTGRLASAVSLYEVVLNISRVAGPAVGGVLLATVGVGACCALNAASYLQPLFVLLRHRPQHAAAGPTAPRSRKAPPGQLRAGLRYAWRNRPIRVWLFLAAASGLKFNLSVQLPLLASRVFHLGGGGYGLMMAVFGIGALPRTEPATSPFAGYMSQTFGARDGFSPSGVALLLTATIGWRALADTA